MCVCVLLICTYTNVLHTAVESPPTRTESRECIIDMRWATLYIHIYTTRSQPTQRMTHASERTHAEERLAYLFVPSRANVCILPRTRSFVQFVSHPVFELLSQAISIFYSAIILVYPRANPWLTHDSRSNNNNNAARTRQPPARACRIPPCTCIYSSGGDGGGVCWVCVFVCMCVRRCFIARSLALSPFLTLSLSDSLPAYRSIRKLAHPYVCLYVGRVPSKRTEHYVNTTSNQYTRTHAHTR